MKNPFLLACLFLTCLIISSCSEKSETENDFTTEGLRPIYTSDETDWQEIYTTDARPVGELGKIYYKDNIIFVNEVDKGIHIIDNTNPSSPTPLHFIRIAGSKDISIKGNYLYADNVTDLVVLDIADFDNISVVNRIPGIYPPTNQAFPEFYTGYFECADTEKGTVIRWENTMLTNPKCRR